MKSKSKDLKKSCPPRELDYQASYENERRWLSFDLLSGRVDRQHPFYDYLIGLGVRQRKWRRSAEMQCLPISWE